ncbi:MAG: TetR/AcrR family transcriptional regulator [Rhodoplanes sp.]
MPTEIERLSRSGAKILVFGPFRLMPRLRLLLGHDTPSRALDLPTALTERPSLQPASYVRAMHEPRNGIEASASLLANFDLTISSDRRYSQIEIEFERDVMAKIDLARRAEIGREKRARTRMQIVDAGLILFAERPPEALTVDAIVESAGVAKGTFYYHFQSVEELVAAVGAKLADTFDELLARSRLDQPDPIERMCFAFTKFLEKAISDPVWARLVVRSAQAPAGVRENLKADLAEAIAEGRLAIEDVELAADIVVGIWLQVARGTLERRAAPDLTRQALQAALRALGVPRGTGAADRGRASRRCKSPIGPK